MGGPIRPPKQQYIPPNRSIFPKLPRLWVMTGSVGLKSKVKTNYPPIPSPSLTKDPISTVWDHGGPYHSPQTTIYTPKTIYFFEEPSIMGNNWMCWPKIQSQTTHPPTSSPSFISSPISTVRDHGGPIRPTKQQYIPLERSVFPMRRRWWVTTGSFCLKSKVKPLIHQPHSHPSPGTPYQQSGTTGGPIRPPKQQYIPPK